VASVGRELSMYGWFIGDEVISDYKTDMRTGGRTGTVKLLKGLMILALVAIPLPCHAGDYEDGINAYSEKRYSEGIIYLKKASNQGNVLAQYKLGLIYEIGDGVEPDLGESASYYYKAAESGYADAQNKLGHMYENGLGVDKDLIMAYYWYGKAADQDHLLARSNISRVGPIDEFDEEASRLPLGSKRNDRGDHVGPYGMVFESHRSKFDFPRTGIKNPEAVAFIINNTNYKNRDIPKVQYAHNDGRSIRDFLVNALGYSPENIVLEKDATQSVFNQLFGTKEDPVGKVRNWVKPEKSDLFIYYSGHGAPDLKTKGAYFVPADADPNYLNVSGYPLSQFYNNISKIPARSIVIVLDTCFSGGSDRGMIIDSASPIFLEVKKPEKVAGDILVFESSSGEQISTWYNKMEHSLFTYYFILGFSGESDADGNKAITVAEMEKYLVENVSYMARRLRGREQTPQIKGNREKILIKY
jgi:hypothetical protein